MGACEGRHDVHTSLVQPFPHDSCQQCSIHKGMGVGLTDGRIVDHGCVGCDVDGGGVGSDVGSIAGEYVGDEVW